MQFPHPNAVLVDTKLLWFRKIERKGDRKAKQPEEMKRVHQRE